MTTATAKGAAPARPEEGARRALAWGAGVLIVGLALVGVGSDGAGMVPVLGGLFLILYGIHTYGRLGPDDGGPGADGPPVRRSAAWAAIWTGGLICLAGLLVTFGSAAGGTGAVVIAYGAMGGGAFRVIQGLNALSRLRRAPTVVEKRRRMNKSAPP